MGEVETLCSSLSDLQLTLRRDKPHKLLPENQRGLCLLDAEAVTD